MPELKLLDEVADVVRSAAKIRADVPVAPESHFVDDLAIDSLDLVGVFLQVQDHFDLAIDDDDLPTLLRVSDLARYVAESRAAAAA